MLRWTLKKFTKVLSKLLRAVRRWKEPLQK